MTTRWALHFLLLSMVVCSIQASAESLWDQLQPNHREMLQSGQVVELEEEINGSPWPRFTIYQLAKSTPEKVASVFWNSELDPKYVPNCLSARIISRPRPSVQDTEYTLKMPLFLPDEVYTARNELKKVSPDIYEVSWKVLQSRYTKECSGSLRIESGGGLTLLCYSNLVVPGSKVAGLLRSRAGTQVVDAVKALVHQVELEEKEDQSLLNRQIEALRMSLSGSESSPVPAVVK